MDVSEWITRRDESLRIVSDELWNKVHAIQTASNPRREAVRLGVANRTFRYRSRYWLGGTLVCGMCGCNYIGDGRTDYLCPAHTAGHCGNDLRFRREDAHQAVFDLLREHLLSDECIQRGKQYIESVIAERQRAEDAATKQAANGDPFRRLNEEIAQLRRMRLRPEAFTAGIAAIEREREELLKRATGNRGAGQSRAHRLLARLPEIVAAYRNQIEQAVKVLTKPELVAEAAETTRRLIVDGKITLVPTADRRGVVGTVYFKELGHHALELAGSSASAGLLVKS